jgi:Mrp family chromosome partitioning ATPase
LDILPAGPTAPNSTELLAAQDMQFLMNEATAHYQMVVLDSPMMGNLADARTLAPLVEAVVFIVRSGYTRLKLARKASLRVGEVGGKLIGVVLNCVDQHKEESYYYSREGDAAVHSDSLLVVDALDRQG